jgi:short-subunit dehydrogenase
VIKRATSGIGRATAIRAARQGDLVVLAARSAPALDAVAAAIRSNGGVAETVTADVAASEDVERIAMTAIERFGRIDAWVNNAAVSVYSTVEHLTIEEIERVIAVDLLGAIYGVKAVLPHMIERGRGIIVNVGSVESVRALPLQAPYSAAKHGLKGFTESLRLELLRDHPNIHVSLILPASIDTPFYEHARSKVGVMARPVPPVYDPDLVASAILHATRHPSRSIAVGGAGQALMLAQKISASTVDRLMTAGQIGFRAQMGQRPPPVADNLDQPVAAIPGSRGSTRRFAFSHSPYTELFELRPGIQRAVAGIALAGLTFASVRRR